MVSQSTFIQGLPRAEARRTPVYWPREIQGIVDSYLPFTTLAGAVQKDLIQNSWDGRKQERGRGWGVTFELLENAQRRPVLVCTDRGTWGLTGPVLREDEYREALPAEYRWARFDSLAFSHPDPRRTLGARGRGKFVFVAASCTQTILYDTLRDDGVYRLGIRWVETTDSPVWCCEGEEARRKLAEFAPALGPLSETSTRVVIDDPVEEVLDAIRSGRFARAMAVTWWPVIEKFGASITLKAFGQEILVQKPREFDLPQEDNRRFKVWLKEREHILYQGRRYPIKRLHIVRDMRGPVPENIQGIAIYRRGMKVTSIRMRGVGRDIEESVYGYIEFDRRLDEEMAAAEDPTHYTFNFTSGVARKVKEYIEDQLDVFAREKLGIGADVRAREAERHREAAQRALSAINRVARSLGIGGPGPDRVRRPPVYINMPEPHFPSNSRRVNYGQQLQGIEARVTNDSEDPIVVQLAICVTKDGALVRDIFSQELSIASGATSPSAGPFALPVAQPDFTPGEHRLRATLLCRAVAGYAEGYKLHEVSHPFWVEEDEPRPLRPIFITLSGPRFPGDTRRVNYGEQLSGITATVTNATGSQARVRLSMWMFQGDRKVWEPGPCDLDLPPGATSGRTGPFTVDVTDNLFLRGECALRARLVCLSSPEFEEGAELHEVTVRFWVEEDPPEHGIFEKCVATRDYPADKVHVDGEAIPGERGGYVLRYNLDHPAIIHWDSEGRLEEYLFNLGARELLRIAYRQEISGFFRQEDLDSPEHILRRASELLGLLNYRYYSASGGR